MGLFALTCPYELSNEAILTSTAFLLGYPVPHARFLKEQVQGYETIDIWGDSLLNTSTHGAAAWKATHDNIAKEIASIATGGGVCTIAVEQKQQALSELLTKTGEYDGHSGKTDSYVKKTSVQQIYQDNHGHEVRAYIFHSRTYPQENTMNNMEDPVRGMHFPSWLPTLGAF